MLDISTDNVFSIGTVASTLQPVVSRRSLVNVPADGLFGYEPTAYLGVYMPDTFWFRTGGQ
jgi:peptide/nickel transport system substrate-binding protein